MVPSDKMIAAFQKQAQIDRSSNITINRDFKNFKGDSLIVGGGWVKDHRENKSVYRTPENFYTIDDDPSAKADAVFNFSNEELCKLFPAHSFKFILFEYFPFGSFFGIDERDKQLTIFRNAKRLLKEDGVLIYIGGGHDPKTTIPQLLQQAGFHSAQYKKVNNEEKGEIDSGYSIASQQNFYLLKKYQHEFPDHIRYSMNEFLFFENDHLDIDLQQNCPGFITILQALLHPGEKAFIPNAEQLTEFNWIVFLEFKNLYFAPYETQIIKQLIFELKKYEVNFSEDLWQRIKTLKSGSLKELLTAFEQLLLTKENPDGTKNQSLFEEGLEPLMPYHLRPRG